MVTHNWQPGNAVPWLSGYDNTKLLTVMHRRKPGVTGGRDKVRCTAGEGDSDGDGSCLYSLAIGEACGQFRGDAWPLHTKSPWPASPSESQRHVCGEHGVSEMHWRMRPMMCTG